MTRWLPLLIVGALLLGGRAATKATTTARAPEPQPPPGPQTFAYLYRLPGDAYETVRMASGVGGAKPVEMGIFAAPAAAVAVAHANGWRLAWEGVREMEKL